jgi:hypothetical protein
VNNIISGTNNAFSFTVLGRSVGARHAKMNPMSKEERDGIGVIELAVVVTLDCLNGGAELSGHISKEISKGGVRVRLKVQRKCPQIVRAIIENDQIIFITRNTNDGRGPYVTMYKIKMTSSTRTRCMKR